MPKKMKRAVRGQEKEVEGGVDRRAGYSLTLGSSLTELTNYDPDAASFLRRTIYNGDYEFTLNVAPRSEAPVESIAPVKITGAYRRDPDGSVVGTRVADVLWQELNIFTYGWNRDPSDVVSRKYLRASLPPSDDADRFVEGYSFPARQNMTASDFWDCLGEVTRRYKAARSAMTGKVGSQVEPETVEKLKGGFARMSGELTSLAEKMAAAAPDGLMLDEYLFAGSSQSIEVCTQHASNGNRKSLICATATHTFSLLFDTS